VLGGIISHFNNLQIILHILSHLHKLYEAMLPSGFFYLVYKENGNAAFVHEGTKANNKPTTSLIHN